jgi:hypothetical protein
MVTIGKPAPQKPAPAPVEVVVPKPVKAKATTPRKPRKKATPKKVQPKIPEDVLESLNWIISTAKSAWRKRIAGVKKQLEDGTRTSKPGFYRDFEKVDEWLKEVKEK